MARKYNERRSLRLALETYLQGKNWNVEFREGWLSEKIITAPLVSIYFLPNAFSELELGRGDAKRNFVRRVQIDCYMKNEETADAITDDIADFIDESTITVTDLSTNTDVGYMYTDTSSISFETVPPIMRDPKVARWRGVVKATYEVFYD